MLLETPPSVIACQLATAVTETCLADRTIRQWYHDFKENELMSVIYLAQEDHERQLLKKTWKR